MCMPHAMPHQDYSLYSFLNFKLENSDFEIFAELERLHSAYAVRVCARRFGVKFTIIRYLEILSTNFPAYSGEYGVKRALVCHTLTGAYSSIRSSTERITRIVKAGHNKSARN